MKENHLEQGQNFFYELCVKFSDFNLEFPTAWFIDHRVLTRDLFKLRELITPKTDQDGRNHLAFLHGRLR